MSGTLMSLKETGTSQLHKWKEAQDPRIPAFQRVHGSQGTMPIRVVMLLYSVVSSKIQSELCHVTYFGQWDISKRDGKRRLAKCLHTRACPIAEHGHGFSHTESHFHGVQANNMWRPHGKDWKPWLVAPLSIRSPARTGQSWGWTPLVGASLPPRKTGPITWNRSPMKQNWEPGPSCRIMSK